MHSQRQPPNLKKIFTSAKFNFTSEKYAVSKCSDSRWSTCPYLKTGDSISLNVARLFYDNEKQLTAPMRVHRKQINDLSTRNAPCCEQFDRYSKGDYQELPF